MHWFPVQEKHTANSTSSKCTIHVWSSTPNGLHWSKEQSEIPVWLQGNPKLSHLQWQPQVNTLKSGFREIWDSKGYLESSQRILWFVYRCRATETGEVLPTKVPSLNWNWMILRFPGSKHNPLYKAAPSPAGFLSDLCSCSPQVSPDWKNWAKRRDYPKRTRVWDVQDKQEAGRVYSGLFGVFSHLKQLCALTIWTGFKLRGVAASLPRWKTAPTLGLWGEMCLRSHTSAWTLQKKTLTALVKRCKSRKRNKTFGYLCAKKSSMAV